MMGTNAERAKQRWRRRTVLVVDEVSMLGLATLYDIDQRLRVLRGFPEKPFGGLPVVVFTGDFLQFGPVLQKSLLCDFQRIAAAATSAKPSCRATERRWKEMEAKKLWGRFTNVVMLEEQKRAQGDTYLLGLLERLREGKQTLDDAARLQSRYDPNTRFDFSNGRRAIIPVNRHRWDLTVHAALAYGEETGRHISLYLSAHKWESRVPSTSERTAAMLLGDEGQLNVPGMFPYIEGMPVIVNANKYMGLKVANGAEFTAAGIIHPPGLEGTTIGENLTVFFGPPSGILLKSPTTEDIAVPGLPPNCIMLPACNVRLPSKYAKSLCPGRQGNGFKLGVVRTGLPCTPGLAMTDFKAQGRTLDRTLLGLYGRTLGRTTGGVEKCDAVSMYVQLSRVRRFEDITLIQPLDATQFVHVRMPEELARGIRGLRELARETTGRYEETHGDQCS
jgi:ATP-dependent DNA helicase PIF1